MQSAITHNLYEVDSAITAGDLTSGPKLPLGTLARLGAVDSDVELYYVKAGAAAATDGDVVGNGDPLYDPAASDESVQHFAGAGDSVWIYVKTGGTGLRRGQLAEAVLPSSREVVPSSASVGSARIVGVAQHNIPANSYGWILRSGTGVIGGPAPGAAGIIVKPSATVGGASVASATEVNVGYLVRAFSADYANVDILRLAKAAINCVG